VQPVLRRSRPQSAEFTRGVYPAPTQFRHSNSANSRRVGASAARGRGDCTDWPASTARARGKRPRKSDKTSGRGKPPGRSQRPCRPGFAPLRTPGHLPIMVQTSRLHTALGGRRSPCTRTVQPGRLHYKVERSTSTPAQLQAAEGLDVLGGWLRRKSRATTDRAARHLRTRALLPLALRRSQTDRPAPPRWAARPRPARRAVQWLLRRRAARPQLVRPAVQGA